MSLFGNNVVFDISLSTLIKKVILANPEFERIETNEEIEPIISIDEEKNDSKIWGASRNTGKQNS